MLTEKLVSLRGIKVRSQNIRIGLIAFVLLSFAVISNAHDGWIQTNASRICTGDMVYIDMQFGNHGNTHRDYKIYGSKWDITKSTFTLYTPRGAAINLIDSVIDVGVDETKAAGGVTYIDKNGYLVASFIPKEFGIYIADVRQDMVVSYAPERSIKCAKAIVGSVPSTMGNYRASLRGYDAIFGQVLEIIPLDEPTDLAVGDTLHVQVLYKGAPLRDAHLAVIPRGKTLPPLGEENPYDLMTDMYGKASFTFDEANYHLLVVHVDTAESGSLDGKDYTQTKYAATMTVIVKPTITVIVKPK